MIQNVLKRALKRILCFHLNWYLVRKYWPDDYHDTWQCCECDKNKGFPIDAPPIQFISQT